MWVASLKGHDACIHAALIWDVLPTELELKDTRATVNLMQAASEFGVKSFLYTSSTAVHRPFQPCMAETDRVAPSDYYGATKAAAEAFVSAFAYQTSMRCNVIRPGPTVGVPVVPGAAVSADRRLLEIVRQAAAGEDIQVPTGNRQFSGASDLAKLFSAILHSESNHEVFVGVDPYATPWKTIAVEAVGLVGSASRILANDSVETPLLFNVSKIQRHFGFRFDSRQAMTGHLSHLLAQDATLH